MNVPRLRTGEELAERPRGVEERKRAWRAAASFLFVLSVAFVLFERTLGFGLYLDDNHHARPWALREVLGTFRGPFDPLGIEPPYFRPLLVVTFAVDWAMWGYDAFGYHLTNVLLHALTSALVLVLLRRAGVGRSADVAGALFFAANPANAATAIYVSERSDALVAIFSLLAVLATRRYVKGGRARSSLVAMNAMVVLSLCSKESAAALPLLVVLSFLFFELEATFGFETGDEPRRGPLKVAISGLSRRLRELARSPRVRRDALVVCGPTLALLPAYLAYRGLVLPHALVRYKDVSPVRGFLTAVNWTLRAVPWEVPSLAFPFLVLALVLFVWVGAGSRPLAVILYGFAWIGVACLPLSYLGQVEPRLLYLAEVGLSVVVAGLFAAFRDALQDRERSWNGPAQIQRSVLVLVVSGVFVVATGVSLLRAQKEFEPFGYKMLKGYREVATNLAYRHLYPAHHLEYIDAVLRDHPSPEAKAP